MIVVAVRPAGAPNRVLSAPWLVKLGIFSYSVYLSYLPLTKALDALALSRHWPAALFGVFVTTLPLLPGYGFHAVFERPL